MYKVVRGQVVTGPKFVRCYSFKRQNFLVRSLEYVKEVDEKQKQLQAAPPQAKAVELVKRIATNKELLLVLSVFHHELAKIGITPDSPPEQRSNVWQYRLKYLFKLARLHDVFWQLCLEQNISEQTHELGFLPSTIGLLDPAYFERDVYEQIQRGVLGEVDFTDTEIGLARPPFK